jgi:hypothetical protein
LPPRKDVRDPIPNESPNVNKEAHAVPLRSKSKDIRDTPPSKPTSQPPQAIPGHEHASKRNAMQPAVSRNPSKSSSDVDPKQEKKMPAGGSENSSDSSPNEPVTHSNNEFTGRIGSIRLGQGGELIITISPNELKRFFKSKTATNFKAQVEISFHPKWVNIGIRVTHTEVPDAPFLFETKRITLIESREVQGKPKVNGKRHGITPNWLLELLNSDSVNSILVECREGWPNAPNR